MKVYKQSIQIALLLILCSFSSCTKSDPNEYYVMYSIDSDTYQIGGNLEVFITDENNTQQEYLVSQNNVSEFTIGPVLESFEASILARDAGNANQLRLYARIYVSRNGEPFVIKSRDESEDIRNYVSLDYTIVD
ncbi:MAG: Uncharacterised protein [Flavobacteriaceae bacterium]|nr:MAG: Uncharacterised protein [Flavobacteriaceae bacterium]